MSDMSGGADFFGRIPLFREFAKLLQTGSGPVNWELARQVAIATAAGTDAFGAPGALPPPAPRDPAEVGAWNERLRLAELWVEPVSGLPAAQRPAAAVLVGRSDFAEKILPSIAPLIEPGARVMSEQLGAVGDQPELAQMTSQVGGLLYGVQVGTSVGRLAASVLTRAELALPASGPAQTLIIDENVAALEQTAGLPREELRLWLATREVVQSRVLTGVAWLGDYLPGLIDEVARHTVADTGELLGRLQSMDISHPESIQNMLEGSDVFGTTRSPAAEAALGRLEVLLALVGGYALVVCGRALERHALNAAADIERVMLARAGDEEGTAALFARLLGADPERADPRNGAAFCIEVLRATDVAGLERVWAHPDFLPTSDELSTPGRWLERVGLVGGDELDLDAGLRALLEGAGDDAAGSGDDR